MKGFIGLIAGCVMGSKLHTSLGIFVAWGGCSPRNLRPRYVYVLVLVSQCFSPTTGVLEEMTNRSGKIN